MTAWLSFSGIICALLLGLWRFKGLMQREVETVLAQATTPPEGEAVAEEMPQDVPEPVQRYLRYKGIVGKPFVNTVRLEQKGSM